jgi:hypothetical protein
MGESKIQITNKFAKLFKEKISSSNSLYVGLPVQKEIEDVDRLRHFIPPQQEHILLFDEFSKLANKSIDFLSLEDINSSAGEYDFIVGDLPWGMRRVTWNGNKIEENWAYILELLSKLDSNGYGLFYVPPSFWMSHGAKVKNILHDEGVHLIAAIDPPENALHPYTNIQPSIIILSKKENEHLFIAELLDNEGINDIIENLFNNYSSDYLEQGVFVDRDNFKGFSNYRFKKEIEKIQTGYKSYKEYSLFDIAVEINLGKQNQYFDEKDNAIYFPKVGESKVHYDLKNTTMKHQNYFQIVLNKEIVNNKFAALFYVSDLGRAIRKTLYHGTTIPSISKQSLTDDAIIAIPSLKEQMNISNTYEKIERLNKEVELISNELSLNPQNANNLEEKLDDVLDDLSLFTRSDEIKSLIRKGESKRREYKETLSLDIKSKTKEKYLELNVLKTIAGFLNSEGGDLLIGISDNGEIKGVELEIPKLYKNHDKYLRHFKDILKESIGEDFYPLLEYGLVSVEGKNIFQVKCKKSNRECFLYQKDFYVRTNPATDKLEGRKMVEYIKTHFQ